MKKHSERARQHAYEVGRRAVVEHITAAEADEACGLTREEAIHAAYNRGVEIGLRMAKQLREQHGARR